MFRYMKQMQMIATKTDHLSNGNTKEANPEDQNVSDNRNR